jgi:tetratricopeptide (TPR) repeat protein
MERNTSPGVPDLDRHALPANPFVGLRPFDSNEGPLFFGRNEQTLQLLDQLHLTRFLAVVGSSGCGKSSLIRAGLIPKLKAGFLVKERDQWHVATMKPGDDPLNNLCNALLKTFLGEEGSSEGAALVEEVRAEGAHAIAEFLTPLLEGSSSNLLILVDQFEELFSFALVDAESPVTDTEMMDSGEQQRIEDDRSRRREEATDFVSLMLALADQKSLPIYVVMTMRSDFLGDCDSFYGLPEAMNRSQYLVPRLTRAQRQEAIENPIVLYRNSITPRLLDRVLNDAGEESDQLPVMQHALMRTWENWLHSDRKSIDIEDYDAVGGTQAALSKDAEAALAGMSDEELDLTQRMFQALTDTDAKGRRVRRPAHLSQLAAITGASGSQLLGIIDHFQGGGRSFLTISQDQSDPLIDISHESLIRQWQALRKWVDDEARYRELYLRLVGAALRYYKPEPEDDLWSGPALQYALEWQEKRKPNKAWAERYHPEFDRGMVFLGESKARREEDLAEKERRRNRQAEKERQDLENKQRLAEAEAAARRLELEKVRNLAEQREIFTRRYRKAAIALAVVLIVTLFLAAYAAAKAREAKTNLRLAQENAVTADNAKTTAEGYARLLEKSLKEANDLKGEAESQKQRADAARILADGRAEREEAAKKVALAAIARAKETTDADQLHREAMKESDASHPDKAKEKFLEAIKRYRTIPDLDGVATTYFELGRMLTYSESDWDRYPSPEQAKLRRQERDEGFGYFTSAIENYRQNQDPNGSASVLVKYAESIISVDNMRPLPTDQEGKAAVDARAAAALKKYEEALKDFTTAKNKEGQVNVLEQLAQMSGRDPKSADGKRRAVAYYERIPPLAEQPKAATTLITIGRLYYDLNDESKAMNAFDRAVKSYHAKGDSKGEVTALLSIARLLRGTDASKYYNQAEQLELEPKAKAETLRLIGIQFLEGLSEGDPQERFDRVESYFRRALLIFEGIHDREGQANVHRSLASLYTRSKKVDEAIKSYQVAVTFFDDRRSQGIMYYFIGSLQADRNDIKAAVDSYTTALERMGTSDPAYSGYIQQRLESIKKKLPQ